MGMGINMTREELIERICPADTESECGCVECNFSCEDCNNMLERMLLEYEKQIYNQALEDFGKKMKEANSLALFYREAIDLEKFMNCASDEIKEELMK